MLCAIIRLEEKAYERKIDCSNHEKTTRYSIKGGSILWFGGWGNEQMRHLPHKTTNPHQEATMRTFHQEREPSLKVCEHQFDATMSEV